MPEGPELFLASKFINSVCKGKLFTGQVKKSQISKCPEIDWNVESYAISATSRGKEIKITLTELLETSTTIKHKKKSSAKPEPKPNLNKILNILFRFGLAGKFRYDPVADIQKHAHLNFFTKDEGMVLSFVDYMRFGKWEITDKWGKDRGPCVINESDQFRQNVLSNLHGRVFNKPICEVLLDQKYFNGIGNYLRAEILYRAKIPPFVQAREVLEGLPAIDERAKTDDIEQDILDLCSKIPLEVISLSTTGSSGYEDDSSEEDQSAFSMWLQCYYNHEMTNVADHNGRTIWFCGEPGPLIPEDAQERHTKGKRKKKTSKVAFVMNSKDNESEDTKKVSTNPSKVNIAHMSGDHDYNDGQQKPKPKKRKSTTPDILKEDAEELGMECKKLSKKRLKSVKTEEVCVDTNSTIKRAKRTNAHDWPTTPKKRRPRKMNP